MPLELSVDLHEVTKGDAPLDGGSDNLGVGRVSKYPWVVVGNRVAGKRLVDAGKAWIVSTRVSVSAHPIVELGGGQSSAMAPAEDNPGGCVQPAL